MVIIDIYMKKLFKSAKGFTLVELLIVIAILGVLAAVVLVAINPAEQLARGRDASRLQEVAQLGHSVQAYYTAQGALLSTYTSGVAPTAMTNANWQAILVATLDISSVVTSPAGGTACTVGAVPSSAQAGFCYTESGTNFLVWGPAESGLYKGKAKCTAALPIPFFIYDSSQGKAGVACVATAGTAPAVGITLN